jgi:hypothetical protein
MKAIIQTSKSSWGNEIALLGYGSTEQAARMAAFASVHHGHNRYDDEFEGGLLVDVAPALAALLSGEGDDAGLNLQHAMATLVLDGNVLSAKRYCPPVIVEQDNCMTLTRSDLNLGVEELYEQVAQRPGRAGLPRLTYQDHFDKFSMRLEKSNIGYSVSCMLNGAMSYQLNGRYFSGSTQIGVVMLLAAGAKKQTIDELDGKIVYNEATDMYEIILDEEKMPEVKIAGTVVLVRLH